VPREVDEAVANIGIYLNQEQYEQIYNDSSELWKKDVTLEAIKRGLQNPAYQSSES
jgi:hypothetical protein